MPEEFAKAELPDATLALLDCFTEEIDAQRRTRSLRKVCADLGRPKDDVDGERTLIRQLARTLGPGMPDGVPPELFETFGTRGSFATEAAIRMRPAITAIRGRRSRKLAEHRVLPYVQLVSAVDDRPLRIGGYQAHYERFLGAVVVRLRQLFPWIQVNAALAENRDREGGGALQAMFAGTPADESRRQEAVEPSIDYMLVPGDSDMTCYRYTLRVVGDAQNLKRVWTDERERVGIPIEWLSGEVLLTAPLKHSSRDRLMGLLVDHGVTAADVVSVPTPLMLLVRGLSGEGFAILSDEYSAVGYPGNPYPYLLEGHTPYSQNMTIRGRSELRGGVHLALRFVVDSLRAEEKEQRWLGRPSSLG